MYLSFFLTITLFVYIMLMFRQTKMEKKKNPRLELLLNQETSEMVENDVTPSVYKRIIQPLFHEYKKNFKRRLPGDLAAKLELKLLQAGSPFNMTPVEFRLFQIGLLIVFPVIFGFYGYLLHRGLSNAFIFSLIGAVGGLFLPNYYLKQKAKQRNKVALRELPDTLDLLTVSLEAGLGFDAALSKIVSKKEGVLAYELTRCLEEIRLGKTRRDALTGVKERLVVQEIGALINSILQAEKLGIGMVQVLRVQSQDVRERRKQRAEEEAMKAPIKMLFPLVLFIFPSLFIVLLGPAVIQFIEAFNN
jgi:tight adherence protein C